MNIFQLGLFIYRKGGGEGNRAYFGVDIEELGDDERGEGDGDDVGEGLVEEDEGCEHDHATLEDRFPNPNQEGLG